MAELTSIQRVPRGLLELLGMRGTGKNPNALDSTVRPDLSVKQLFALSVLSDRSNGFNTGANGVAAALVVPDNQYWLILSAVAIARVDGVATTWSQARLHMRYSRSNAGSAVAGDMTIAVNQTNGFDVSGGGAATLPDNWVTHAFRTFEEPQVIAPGGGFRAFHLFNGGATGDIALEVVFGLLT